jgi:hypothetical protein
MKADRPMASSICATSVSMARAVRCGRRGGAGRRGACPGLPGRGGRGRQRWARAARAARRGGAGAAARRRGAVRPLRVRAAAWEGRGAVRGRCARSTTRAGAAGARPGTAAPRPRVHPIPSGFTLPLKPAGAPMAGPSDLQPARDRAPAGGGPPGTPALSITRCFARSPSLHPLHPGAHLGWAPGEGGGGGGGSPARGGGVRDGSAMGRTAGRRRGIGLRPGGEAFWGPHWPGEKGKLAAARAGRQNRTGIGPSLPRPLPPAAAGSRSGGAPLPRPPRAPAAGLPARAAAAGRGGGRRRAAPRPRPGAACAP